jgi:hypothetical protein
VLGHVGGRAAVLAAERQPLQQPQQDEDHRRGDADPCVRGQEPDQEGRDAHDHDGEQERVLAPDEVAEPSEDERPERAHGEARRERQQREDERGGGIDGGEELPADDRGERAVQVEVVPLEHRAERRREDHAADAMRDDGGGGHPGICAR